MIGIGLALLMAVSVWGVFAGLRMYRAEAKLPSDLVLALEVGSTRTGAVDSSSTVWACATPRPCCV